MVFFPVLCQLMDQFSGEELKEQIAAHVDDLVPKHIIKEDIMASINYLNGLAHNIGTPDDIDHLGNRRLRCVGELIQNQFRDRKSTRLNSSHSGESRMPSSA